MAKEKQKHAKVSKAKAKPTKQENKRAEMELTNESLDGVSGGVVALETAIPSFGSAGLASDQTPKCISQ